MKKRLIKRLKRYDDGSKTYDANTGAAYGTLPEVVVTAKKPRNILKEWWDDISSYNFLGDVFDKNASRHMMADLQQLGIYPAPVENNGVTYSTAPIIGSADEITGRIMNSPIINSVRSNIRNSFGALNALSERNIRALSKSATPDYREQILNMLEKKFPGIKNASSLILDFDDFYAGYPEHVKDIGKKLLSGEIDAVDFMQGMNVMKKTKQGMPGWYPGYANERFLPTRSDFAHTLYENMTPAEASYKGMYDISNVPVGGRILMDHLSTDSYPLISNAFMENAAQSPLWNKYINYVKGILANGPKTPFEYPFKHVDLNNFVAPTYELDPITEYIRLNRLGKLGKLDPQKAVTRLNKHLQNLSESKGIDIPEAYLDKNGYDIFAPFLHGTRVHDKGKSIHIKPANKGKFKKNIKIPK